MKKANFRENSPFHESLHLAQIHYISATNKSNVTTILFLGFQNISEVNVLLFIFFLVIYCVTICGNAFLITLVSISKTLHSPMYFFVSQLSIADIILTTDISPNMLNIVLHEQTSISISSCLTQCFFLGLLVVSDCLILTVMSYDRYMAICSPLHYTSVMNHVHCIKLVLVSWLISSLISLIIVLNISQLQFCGSNTIDHFFCDLNPLVKLLCSDVSEIQMEITLLSVPVIVLPFFVIIFSYVHIILTILKISSLSGRQKAFSTCSSHLTIVSMFYGTLFGMYVLPNEGQSQTMNKAMSMLYTVFTPFLNPFIYSLRNKDIKKAFRKVVGNLKFYSKTMTQENNKKLTDI
ncbi:olfactory receptor 11L1-like [Hyperolius riggenbachi]|uniref:olfactory receptor 11L1-like n=1 Tax=Hyperolius riggenbachi TaxID=752182 RepID=UPI0035A2D581